MAETADLRRLLEEGDRACRSHDWAGLETVVRALSPTLPARLELLAAQVVYLLEDGDESLAEGVWSHLVDGVRGNLRGDTVAARVSLAR